MARSFRTAPWALVGVVILALWAWSTYVAAPSPAPGAPASPRSAESRESRGADAREAVGKRDASRGSAAGTQVDDATTRARDPGSASPAWLPPEARDTLRLIARGGPFPHRQDGGTFGNRERQLPPQPRGWYREYTVETPGSRDRGARRIITGGDPPIEFHYTDDHYRSFRRIPGAAGAQ